MRYVRIEFAAYAGLIDQDLNALSLHAVRRGTTIEYIARRSG